MNKHNNPIFGADPTVLPYSNLDIFICISCDHEIGDHIPPTEVPKVTKGLIYIHHYSGFPLQHQIPM